MTDAGPATKAKYEPLTNPEKLVKDQPPKFRWLKYEPQVLMAIVIIWATLVIYDLALANRKAAASEKIVGLEDGYFGIKRVSIILYDEFNNKRIIMILNGGHGEIVWACWSLS